MIVKSSDLLDPDVLLGYTVQDINTGTVYTVDLCDDYKHYTVTQAKKSGDLINKWESLNKGQVKEKLKSCKFFWG